MKSLPGITGWAQINGRNALSWEEKFSLDVWYVENWSLMLDLELSLATFGSVLRREGIHGTNHATMPEFPGNGKSISGKELISVSLQSQEEHA